MIPDEFDDTWQVRAEKMVGQYRCIARAPGGVALIFVGTPDSSWFVTKMQGGRILDEDEFQVLSPPIEAAITTISRKEHHERRAAIKAGRRPADDADPGPLAAGSSVVPREPEPSA